MKKTSNNRKTTLLTLIILVVISLFTVTSCNNEVLYSVQFMDNNPSDQYSVTGMPQEMKVPAGTQIDNISQPSLEGYIFDGWYDSSDTIDAIEFPYTVTGDTILYARWREITEITINFKSNNPTNDTPVTNLPEPITLEEGELLREPQQPSLIGYNFTGWYTSTNTTENSKVVFPYTLPQAIDSLTLYAGWEKETTAAKIIITFEENSPSGTSTVSNLPESISIEEGGQMQEPQQPSLSGYSFTGWYTSPDTTENSKVAFPYTLPQAIDSLTLYAGWKETRITDGPMTFVYSDGSYALSSFSQENITSTEIVIPSECNGLPVTAIKDSAFEYCSKITSITIPDSVTSIGAFAFNYCTALKTIKLSNNITSIRLGTFYRCHSLESIDIPDSVTSIGDDAFLKCSSLASINIPSSVTSIGANAFEECSSLTKIVIPDGVTSIEEYTFHYCSSLISVEIPDSVTSIGNSAFRYCFDLISIDIPDSVTSIGSRAFSDCYDLTSINISANITSIGYNTFYYCSSLTSVDIPNSVTSIGENAFGNCSSLSNINIPDCVTLIGRNAFEDCSSLSNINIPDGVTSIGDTAFGGCSSLAKINIPDSVTFIGSGAFIGCNISIKINTEEIPSTWDSRWIYGVDNATVTNSKSEVIYS